ncbi:3'-5' exoribonuclease [Pedobacter sp. PAMC26386]|nr:3'-5' exoribonuclease [Pedobacter sp. PAMC26386]
MENVKKLGHLMVDIETMGSKSYSVICSIAAVEFDLATGETGRTFNCNIDIQSCMNAGLNVDGDTILWWLKQSEEARLNILVNPEQLVIALLNFTEFVDGLSPDQLKVWGNSARFDLGIIENALQTKGQTVLWKHWNERDVRTLVSLAPEVKKGIPFIGTRHDALADCHHQIKYCSATYKKLMGYE